MPRASAAPSLDRLSSVLLDIPREPAWLYEVKCDECRVLANTESEDGKLGAPDLADTFVPRSGDSPSAKAVPFSALPRNRRLLPKSPSATTTPAVAFFSSMTIGRIPISTPAQHIPVTACNQTGRQEVAIPICAFARARRRDGKAPVLFLPRRPLVVQTDQGEATRRGANCGLNAISPMWLICDHRPPCNALQRRDPQAGDLCMGAIAVVGMTLFIWRLASTRAALAFAAFLIVGVAYYWIADEQRPCNDRAWFCDIMPERGTGFVGTPEKMCPTDVEPLTARVFESDAPEAELRRLLSVGVCQNDAIKRVRKGWKAPFHPNYGTWWQRVLY